MKKKKPLQKLLQQRSIAESESKREYLEALEKVNGRHQSIQNMHHQISESLQKSHSVILSGNEMVAYLSMLDRFLEGQKVKVQREQNELREEIQEMENKHAVFLEAFKEKKAIEKLNEKREKEWKKEQQKREVKEQDDLVVMRFERENQL